MTSRPQYARRIAAGLHTAVPRATGMFIFLLINAVRGLVAESRTRSQILRVIKTRIQYKLTHKFLQSKNEAPNLCKLH